MMWTDFFWFRIGFIAGYCVQENEDSSVVKGGEFIGKLNGFLLIREDSVPWS